MPVLKAVFLYGFIKFAKWPGDALSPAASLKLCVIEAPEVAGALAAMAQGHTVDDHPLVVRRETLEGALRQCHVVYAPALNRRESLALIDAVGAFPVLTITDNPEFAAWGGIANLLPEHDTITCAVNLGATQRARLTISSRLLALAKIVHD